MLVEQCLHVRDAVAKERREFIVREDRAMACEKDQQKGGLVV